MQSQKSKSQSELAQSSNDYFYMATNGYILVKDKDGKMKYFKDGKYYSPDEIRNAAKAQWPQTQSVERKQELKPIYSFNSVKKTGCAADNSQTVGRSGKRGAD